MGEARLHLSVGLYRSTLTINARNVALKLKGNSSLRHFPRLLNRTLINPVLFCSFAVAVEHKSKRQESTDDEKNQSFAKEDALKIRFWLL